MAPAVGDLNGGVWQVAVATEAGEEGLAVTLGARLTTTSAGLTLSDTLALSGNAGVATIRVRASAPGATGTLRVFVIGQADSEISINVRAVDALAVTAVEPTTLSAGDTITVRGRRFGSDVGAVQVRIGSQQANVVSLSGDTLIRATMPSCTAAAVLPVSVQVRAAAIAAGSVTTVASATPTRLTPYQRLVVSDTALARGCLTLPADGARYVLMPQLASALDGGTENPGDSTVLYLLSAQTTGAVLAPAVAVPSSLELPAPETDEPVSLADRFHRAIRDRERVLATTQTPAAPYVELPLLVAPPALNSERTFQVLSSLDPGSSNFRDVRARLAYAGNHVLVYVDAAPQVGVGFTAAEISAMGPLLDGPMHDLATQNFGGETDIDGNGRVILLLTDAVNRLTPPPCGQGYIAGFFNPLDFFPGQRGSNNAEIFYAAVPDPAGSVGCALANNQLVGTTPATFIHEFQHMISYGQHVLVRRGTTEEIWANEGLSHLAEETAGLWYETRYRGSSGRSNPTNFFPDSAGPFSAPQLQNAYRWLNGLQGATATVTAYGATGSLAERGASWLFFRYLVAQYGPTLPARLVATRRTGRANIVAETGVPFQTLFADFAAAIIADSIVGAPAANVPSRFRFGELRNLRRIFARFNVNNPQEFRDVFPIRADSVVVGGAPRQGRLRPGAIQYTFLNTPASGPGVTIRLTRENGAAFVSRSHPQLVVLRLP
ncbi:MAG: IPT/TIG domain-containing protein [Gemmatimonadaceae bacterium]|nr:IPT/TIG domain-containing protein [Gemmatimonadaceae bacterium]